MSGNNSLLDVNRQLHVEQLMKLIQTYGDAQYAAGVVDADKKGNPVERAINRNNATIRVRELHQMVGYQLNHIIKAHDEAASSNHQ